MAKVIFSFEGKEIYIQCLEEDKMRDICKKFSSKINIDINLLLFIYNGNKINFELRFKDQANILDSNRNQMNILVYRNGNDINIDKYGKGTLLPKLDSILKNNNNQKDLLIEMKNQLESILKI